jgi:hypothetical protein
MEPIVLVETQDLIVGDPDRRPVVAVQRIIEWNHRVEVVVAARELQRDEHGVFLCCGHA